MIDVIRNVTAAGVVPVISAGNDRDQFGMGTVGSPGSAPEAITRCGGLEHACLRARRSRCARAGAPADVKQLRDRRLRRHPLSRARMPSAPTGWSTSEHSPERTASPSTGVSAALTTTRTIPAKSSLRPGSLNGDVALLSRGHCTFLSKAVRAAQAGATALVLVDNRAGGPDAIPVELPLPAGMISDLDGARLRAYLATNGGAADVTIGNAIERVENGRSGVVTSFSSGGPTAFEHLLKPDVSAPGGQILSSTLPEFTGGSPFAVFDGTSMAAPHVAGAAALLLQLHRGWSPQQVKSALVSTAGAAWADTARTQEAPVTLEGGGLVDLPARDRRSCSPSLRRSRFRISTSTVAATASARRSRHRRRRRRRHVASAAGAAGDLGRCVARRAAGALRPARRRSRPRRGRARQRRAAAGEDYGFILLRRGEVTRKIPYEFFVGRPQLGLLQPKRLAKLPAGRHDQRAEPRLRRTAARPRRSARRPTTSGPTDERDRHGDALRHEHRQARRQPRRRDRGVERRLARSIPWFLGSPNERDVQGYAGTPINVNELMYDFSVDIGSAGASFPKVQRFYVSVDSGSDDFTHRPLPGQLRAPLVGERRSAADASPADEARRRRTPDDRGAGGRQRRRRRPAVARDRVPRRARRRRALRPDLRHRDLPAAAAGGRDPERTHARRPRRVRLTRSRRTSTRSATTSSRTRRSGPCRITGGLRPGADVGHPRGESVRRQDRRIRRGCASSTKPDPIGALLRRRQAGRRRPERRRPGSSRLRGRRAARRQGRHELRAPSRPTAAGARRRDATREGLPVAGPRSGRHRRSSGIGEAIARALAGGRLARWCCLRAARTGCGHSPRSSAREYELCDVGRRDDVERVAAAVLARHPQIHLLVNNAGIPGRAGSRRSTSNGSRSSCA